MPQRILPRTYGQRRYVFRKASRKGNNTASNLHPVSAARWAQLDLTQPASIARVFIDALAVVRADTQALGLSTDQVETALAFARKLISHFFRVFDMAIERGVWPAAHREYHGRNKNATAIPLINSIEEAVNWAENIASGEAERLADEGAAFIPMALPSNVQVQAGVEALTDLLGPHSTLKDALTDSEQLLLNLLPGPGGVDKLILDLYDDSDNHNRDLTDGARRDKGREWGMIFEGDVIDEDDDGSGGSSSSSSSSSSSTGDPLTAVQNVSISAGTAGSGAGTVSWDPNPAGENVEEYEVRRDNTVIATAPGSAGSVEITGFEPGESLTLTVRAKRGATTGPASEPVTGNVG